MTKDLAICQHGNKVHPVLSLYTACSHFAFAS